MMRTRLHTLLAVVLWTTLQLPLASYAQQEAQTVEMHRYFVELAQREPTVNHQQLVELTDRQIVHRKMTVEEMSDFIKSTLWQTRMVYAYSRATTKSDGIKYMTPYDLVHSLADDLFQRKALRRFVSKRQRDGLLLRRDIIDWALEGRRFTEDALYELAAEYDRNTFKQEDDNRDVNL